MTTYLFPGQGSQIKGMGETLFEELPELTRIADEVLGYSIKALCLIDADNNLNKTAYTQPALYVVNALSYEQRIRKLDKEPEFLVGHSLGEYNALQAAGAISFEQGLQLVKKRGELMSHVADGAMAAILNITESDVQACLTDNKLERIDIANFNSPTQTVISGAREEIDKAQHPFEEMGAFFVPLNTSGAFHSRYMSPARSEFELFLNNFQFSPLRIPVISNVDAKPYQNECIAENLAKQITGSVRWKHSMYYLFQRGEAEQEELGVGDVLTKLALKNKESYIAEFGEIISNKKCDLNDSVVDIVATERDINISQNGTAETIMLSIEEWNKRYPVGTRVKVAGYDEILTTTTPALTLFGHREAIYIQGYKGYFSLSDVAVAQ